MQFHDELIKTALTIAGSYAVFRITLKQPKLTYFLSGFASCKIPTPNGNPVVVWISQITIQNTGKAPARNVRVAHHFMPQHWQVIQAVPYVVEKVDNIDRLIRFESIEPGVIVTISYLDTDYKRITTSHDQVRSDEGIVQVTPVQLQRVSSKSVNLMLAGLALLGTYQAISICYSLTQRLAPVIFPGGVARLP